MVSSSGSATLPLPSFHDSPSRQTRSNTRAFLSQAQSIGITTLDPALVESSTAEQLPSESSPLSGSKKRKSILQDVESSLMEAPRPKRTKLAE
jgi:hypothetical protein